MPSNRRTEFAPFVLDLLDFMEEKIREAIDNESSRPAAVSEAAGAVPLLRAGRHDGRFASKRLALVMRFRHCRRHLGKSRFRQVRNVTRWGAG
ncbi:hypothetical protein SAMN05443247_00012 [Bradyrhizobium erythrophlei]|jgi:hypothetical protein|nr:hypothetical protein SAMN05443247_00012 [Bradyrhizobium erythrophlei]